MRVGGFNGEEVGRGQGESETRVSSFMFHNFFTGLLFLNFNFLNKKKTVIIKSNISQKVFFITLIKRCHKVLIQGPN